MFVNSGGKMNQPLLFVPRSSLGSKFLMAVTGLLLFGFVIIHMLGNLQLFLGPEALNAYAAKLKSIPVLLWTARLGLLAIAVAHITYGTWLWLTNRAARPIPYSYRRFRQATLASRTMIITGSVILVFVIFHLMHFTWGLWTNAPTPDPVTGAPTTHFLDLKDAQLHHDVYRMVVYGFREPVIALGYVVAMGFLCYHLSHGIQSLLQSLGLSNRRREGLLHKVSLTLAVLLFIGNSSMPLAVLFRLVGGDVS